MAETLGGFRDLRSWESFSDTFHRFVKLEEYGYGVCGQVLLTVIFRRRCFHLKLIPNKRPRPHSVSNITHRKLRFQPETCILFLFSIRTKTEKLLP